MTDARPVSRSAGELSDAAPAPAHGRLAAELRASWWYSASGLVLLIAGANALPLVPAVARAQTGPAQTVPLVVLCAASAGVQVFFAAGLRDGMGRGVRSVPAAAAMGVSAAAILGLGAPLQWSALPLVSAASLVACQLVGTRRWAAWAVAVAAIAVEFAAVPAGSGRGIGSFILHAIYPSMIAATAWAWDVLRRVNEARAAEGRLAVARERLRFAADLHDIQGHTLQVIALKAELAERLLPDAGAPDPARAAAARAQIAEVRTLAADALAETRQLVRGYRAPELGEELANARDVLAAAGFACRTDADHLPADPAICEAFGRVLREATTNILRHAAPGPVDIAVAERPDGWQLRVGNAVAAAGSPESAATDGSGLAGLRARLAAAGGRLDVLSDDSTDRFTLLAAMPGAGSSGGAPARAADAATDPEVPR